MARLVCGIAPPPSRGTRRSFQDLFAESIFGTTAAGPGDGRFCQACLRVHMSHAANRGGCGAVTGGLDGFREAQILLRRVRGRTLTLPHDQELCARSDMSFWTACRYRLG